MESASLTRSDAGRPAEAPQLKKGAISFLSNVVIGVSSTAPGYSLAATIGFIVLIGGMATHMPSVIVVSFIPMYCIAMAYNAMNKVDPDCGTTFSWMTRAMGAGWGWVGGWVIIFSSIVVNANQGDLAGSYGFQLVGLNNAANSTLDVMILGGVFIIVLTWICWKGIEISARVQQLLLAFEMSTLIIFAVVALIKVYANHPPGSETIQLGWFSPFHLSYSALSVGLLLGVFLYWGWDTGVAVNEETENASTAPGKAALVSNYVLIGIFLLVSCASQAYGGTNYLGKNANDIFSGGLSRGVLGPLHFLLTIAVLTSTTAATQTTILPCARQALSMGRRGAIPARFAEIHPRNLIPAFATITCGILSLIWFVVIINLSTNVLSDCVSGLGFLVCFYYGFTGVACAIFHRHELRKSFKNMLTLAIAPLFGFAVLMFVFVKGMAYYGHASNDVSPPLLGLGLPDWIGIIGIGGGVILMAIRRLTNPAFFRNEKRIVYGDKIEVVTPEAEFEPASSML